MEMPEKKLYATQFHPEVLHTQEGVKMLSNFVYKVCGCSGDWKMSSFVEDTIRSIREKVGRRQSALCPFRWGRLFRGSSPSFKGNRQTVDLRLC